MTCEVAVANRLAIALAADSAVTTTESGKTTYASGANKIFQLANDAPVAIMINNASTLTGIPWELIIKLYRKQLKDRTFPTLQAYWEDFLTYLNEPAHGLLTAELRSNSGGTAIALAAAQIVRDVVSKRQALSSPATPDPDLAQNWADGLAEVEALLGALPVSPALEVAEQAPLLATHRADLTKQVGEYLATDDAHLVPHIDVGRLLEIAAESAFKRPVLVATGIVIAGYGEDDFLPGFIGKSVYGFVGSRVMWKDGHSESVNNATQPSLISGFAQVAMVETFALGASPEVWGAVADAFAKHAADAARAACTASGVVAVDPAVVTASVEAQAQLFQDNWTSATIRAHLHPLFASIASLNVEELAELAETLVLLESLKEKVTARTQSVGGPIDVAVITKSEGLVWIKRKLYFDPHINPRYFNRLQRS
ncbi:hypothetical protein [Roseateles sp.]|uniref:hypothetical protein n=1 Tax=Roseateles sp. TaxID=1971397 RepID=UPI0031DE596A